LFSLVRRTFIAAHRRKSAAIDWQQLALRRVGSSERGEKNFQILSKDPEPTVRLGDLPPKKWTGLSCF
jgi:hypothetical protein